MDAADPSMPTTIRLASIVGSLLPPLRHCVPVAHLTLCRGSRRRTEQFVVHLQALGPRAAGPVAVGALWPTRRGPRAPDCRVATTYRRSEVEGAWHEISWCVGGAASDLSPRTPGSTTAPPCLGCTGKTSASRLKRSWPNGSPAVRSVIRTSPSSGPPSRAGRLNSSLPSPARLSWWWLAATGVAGSPDCFLVPSGQRWHTGHAVQ